MTFSDTNNPMFPSAQEILILTGTTNVVLTCSLPECIWMKSDESDVTTIDSYIIPEISDSYSKIFSLVRVTTDGVSYTTAHVHIRAHVVTQSPSNSTLVTGVIIALVLVITLVAIIIIIIPLCIFFYRKKRKTTKHPEPSVDDKPKSHSYENIPQPNPSTTKEYITLPYTPNPDYMTIDETTMIPLEPLNEPKQKVFESTLTTL